ncbi:MAG TPA: metal-dependent transcriptional regulator [Propionicimonas sp.]|nr:metal-dependent transcriptional regulator [Propionicimonas sp.]HRA06249.1 metal-dependent transcriptional regulator [Propionicimonas sp.]
MSDLIDTTEMYLRTIYELGEEGVPPLRARIAERLKQSGPTVSQTVARMERDGLVSVHPDRHLVLSAHGLELATRVMRRHRLAERLLTDVIGLEWPLVHEEACRWEHVISTDVERRLVAILDHPVSSPYGNPIPALEELDVDPAPETFLDGTELLSLRLADGQVHDVVVRRMSESIQADPRLLAALSKAGCLPGVPVRASIVSKSLLLGTQDEVIVPAAIAEHLFVAAE